MCMGTPKERQEQCCRLIREQQQKWGGKLAPGSQRSALSTTFYPFQPEVLSFPCRPFQTFLENWRDMAQRVL